ncbi:MAG TPA: methylmalonyl-CoA mutase family protein [Cytophagaceae bacterium]
MDFNKPLDFSEFPQVSSEEWHQKILSEMKGKELPSYIRDLNFKPFYTSEDINSSDSYYINKPSSDWAVRELIKADDVATAIRLSKTAIDSGVQELLLEYTEKPVVENVKQLLDNIPLKDIAVHFNISDAPEVIINTLKEKIKEDKLRRYEVKGSLSLDPIGYWILNDLLKYRQFDQLAELVNSTGEIPNFKFITINSHPFHNLGLPAIKELAFSLSAAVEYIEQLKERECRPEDVIQSIQFSISVGKHYFMEISKLRALRLLWPNILKAYNINSDIPLIINARTSFYSKSLIDPYVNIIHNTTEAMAAISGGCDSLTVIPFDEDLAEPGEFSSRISRNTSYILKEEAYFNKVADPTAGSYFIETLTNILAREIWILFQIVEENGGLIKAQQKGVIEIA